jgi:hypothetical protein
MTAKILVFYFILSLEESGYHARQTVCSLAKVMIISDMFVQPSHWFRFFSTKGIFQISLTRMLDPYRRAEGIKHWP